MDRHEAADIKRECGHLRPRDERVKALPWSELADVCDDISTDFVWSPKTEEAFLSLVKSGHTIRQICNQNRPGWPTYRQYLLKIGQDTNFAKMLKSQNQNRADALADAALARAETSREASVRSDKVFIDTALRVAASLSPETWGQKQQVGISGGLVLAAGSLADLAAQAALRNTDSQIGVTDGHTKAIDSPVLLDHSNNRE